MKLQLDSKNAAIRDKRSAILTYLLLPTSLFLFILVRLLSSGSDKSLLLTISGSFFYISIAYFIIEKQQWPRFDKSLVMIIFTIAFIIRLTVAIFFFPYSIMHNLSPDQSAYIEVGKQLAQIWHWPDNPFVLLVTKLHRWGHIGIYVFVAIHFKLVQSVFFIFCTNIFLSAFCIVPLYRISSRIFVASKYRRQIFLALIIYALFPPSIFWSVFVLKEMVCVFLTMLFIDKLMDYLNGRILTSLFWMLLIMAIVSTFRMYLVPIFVLLSILSLFLYPIKHKKVIYISILCCLLLSVLITWQFNRISQMPSFSPIVNTSLSFFSEESFSVISGARENLSSHAPTDIQGITYSSPIDMVKVLPIGILRTFTTPISWLRTDKSLVEQINIYIAFFWYLLLPFALIGFFEYVKCFPRNGITVTSFVTLLILFFSIVNLGGSFRQNNLLYPFFCLFSAMGIFQLQKTFFIVFITYLFLALLVIQTSFSVEFIFFIILPSILIPLIIFIRRAITKPKQSKATN